MPRARTAKDTEIKDIPLDGLGDLPQDPAPAAGRRPPGRPRGAKTAPAKIAHRAADGRAMTKAQLKRNVAIEMYGFAQMFAGILGMKDPDCIEPLFEKVETPDGTQERLAAIVDRTVNLLARSDKVLSGLATTGIIGEIAMLGGLLLPVAKQVWQAHGPGGHGHKTGENVDDLAKYPAPAFA